VRTFVLVPGAGGAAWYWTRTAVELERRGHRAVTVDLPQDDPGLGLVDWANAADDAIPPAPADTVLVAQSLGGFLAPLVRRPVGPIVLLNAMIPLPCESPDQWWDATGARAAREAADRAAGHDSGFDLEWHFFADLDDAARRRCSPSHPASRPRRRWRPGASSSGGRRCRSGSWSVRTTGSSRRRSSGAWPVSGSASTSTRCPAAISPRPRTRPRSWTGSSRTSPGDHVAPGELGRAPGNMIAAA
jgi:hypothetical protein